MKEIVFTAQQNRNVINKKLIIVRNFRVVPNILLLNEEPIINLKSQ